MYSKGFSAEKAKEYLCAGKKVKLINSINGEYYVKRPDNEHLMFCSLDIENPLLGPSFTLESLSYSKSSEDNYYYLLEDEIDPKDLEDFIKEQQEAIDEASSFVIDDLTFFLIGETIVSAVKENEVIYLITKSNKIFALSASGSVCCEHCYIAQVCGSEVFNNCEVFKIKPLMIDLSKYLEYEDVEENKVDADNQLSIWGYEIVTSKGVFTIEMRLISNGCYSGDLCFYDLPYNDNLDVLKFSKLVDF